MRNMLLAGKEEGRVQLIFHVPPKGRNRDDRMSKCLKFLGRLTKFNYATLVGHVY
jgi:hypothetical protein